MSDEPTPKKSCLESLIMEDDEAGEAESETTSNIGTGIKQQVATDVGETQKTLRVLAEEAPFVNTGESSRVTLVSTPKEVKKASSLLNKHVILLDNKEYLITKWERVVYPDNEVVDVSLDLLDGDGNNSRMKFNIEAPISIVAAQKALCKVTEFGDPPIVQVRTLIGGEKFNIKLNNQEVYEIIYGCKPCKDKWTSLEVIRTNINIWVSEFGCHRENFFHGK